MRERGTLTVGSDPKGFVLVTAAIAASMLLGILGLSTDLARMYVARNEIQAYVDAAAIAAAFELNGTSNGITHARERAASYPNKWNFSTTNVQNVVVTFSDKSNGPYAENPASASGVKYVRVSAEAPVVIYFMPGFSSYNIGGSPAAVFLFTIARTQTLRALATSGQFRVTGFREGLLPYSPDSIDPDDKANFGFKTKKMYTLRWPPPGQRTQKNNWCDGDKEANYSSLSPSAERGFIDIGGGSASFIREAIVNNAQTHPLEIGDFIVAATGNKGTESDALRERFSQDADRYSQTYEEYMNKIYDLDYSGPKGNGRRFVIVPVNDPRPMINGAPNPNLNIVLGFAGFFLHGDVCSNGGDTLTGSNGGGSGGNNVATCCGEYVGPVVVNGRKGGDNNAGAYRVQLFK